LVLVGVAILQLASALVFALTVKRNVFDERYIERDVLRYETDGVSVASIGAQRALFGPGLPILASVGGRAVPGSVVARRIPVYLAWTAAAALLIALAFRRREDAVVPMAGAVLLAHSHTPLSMATLLSEGPAFGCAVAALLLSGLVRPAGASAVWAPRIFLTGLCLGLGIWFRQYYLALVPAFAVAWWRSPPRRLWWVLFAVGPLVAVGGLWALWGGLTSPPARVGILSHSGHLIRASIGFSPWRPFSALAYVGLYALPLLPWGDRTRLPRRDLVVLVVAACLIAAALAASGRSLWDRGPIMVVIQASARVHAALAPVLDGALTVAAFLGALAIGRLTWRLSSSEPLLILCAATVVFFALEQLGVDGAVPFYERYAHQVIFFSTALVLLVAPPPHAAKLVAFIGILVLLSQVTLWVKARPPSPARQPAAAVKCDASRALMPAASWMVTPCAARGISS
jgi:hypothetical protein